VPDGTRPLLILEYVSLSALARGARINDFERPHMTEENIIRIDGGRYDPVKCLERISPIDFGKTSFARAHCAFICGE
jgi:hypothetical protein